MQVRQALHDFISSLELTDAQQRAVSDQHVYLRTQLTRRLPVDPAHGPRLSGSYARSTAIRPLHDVDVFCVLLRTADAQPGQHTPAQVLGHVRRTLESIYDGKTVDRQNRSVNIAFTGTGVAYDIVPAFADGNTYLIPDLKRSKWIRTNPTVHAERASTANEAAGKELKPLTKAVKHWNRRLPESQQLRSFLLEVMAWDVIQRKPASRLEGLRDLFGGLATRIARPTRDPAGLGPDLDEDLTPAQRQAAAARLRDAANSVERAILAAGRADVHGAHAELYALFGSEYPARGR